LLDAFTPRRQFTRSNHFWVLLNGSRAIADHANVHLFQVGIGEALADTKMFVANVIMPRRQS